MNELFSAILNRHEAEDDAQIREEAQILAAIRREFSNSEELLKEAKMRHITIRDVREGRVADFPITPVRQSEEFYLKKHTESQIPYFHGHRFFELIYVHRGECVQRFQNGSVLKLTEGQCVLICPGAVHLIEAIGRTDIVLKMVIPCDLFAETGGKAFGGVSLSGFVLFDRVSETAEFAILKLLEYQVRKTNRKDLLLRSFLTIVFAELADSGQNDLSWELLLNEYFETYCRTASLSEFAAMKNYQVNYASRLIKKHTGKSFSELLSAYRIDRAKRLLTDGTLPVEEIAAEVGYKTPSGLYKQFFSCVGMNPAEYRRLFR